MSELVFALGLVFLLEGVLYALFPEVMRKMMVKVIEMPETTLRYTGLAAAVIGFCIIYAVKT